MRNLSFDIKHLKTKIAILLAVAGLGTAIIAFAQVSAFGNNTLYVGHGAVGNGSSCESPGYNSVQTAVNAAQKGDTVYLCGGTFAEQVFVNDKSITITGDSSSGLSAPATFAPALSYPSEFTTDSLVVPQTLVVLTGNSNTTIKGLNFNGPMPGNGGCGSEEYGILALSGNVNLENDSVTKIADQNTSLYGCQFGVAIEIGSETWPVTGFGSYPTVNYAATADIDNVTVSGYQKNGITVDGPNSSATINGSTIVGGDPYSAFGVIIAQNGIQISDGATGKIKNNIITNNAYTGDGYASATGILIFGGYGSPLSTDVKVDKNKLIDNDIAIAFADYNTDGSGAATTKTDNEASNNWIFSGQVTNVSGLCNDTTSCGGEYIGYQAGIEDIGNSDSACYNNIQGPGYQNQGEYNYSVTPSVFTQTGPNPAFVRQIDAGDSFPTINFSSCDHNQYHNGGYYANYNYRHQKYSGWFKH